MARGMTKDSPSRALGRCPEEQLLPLVRPAEWKNPQRQDAYDLAIVGAGPAGLAAAEMAIRLGVKVALVERQWLGGNSLNRGSIPSKAIIRSARLYAAIPEADELRTSSIGEPRADFAAVMARMQHIRARIAQYHSADRLRDAGIDVYFGHAQFVGRNCLTVADEKLKFKKALIATGAHPRPSAIPGLEQVGYQTSDTIFDITAMPRRLAIIGGGPLGCELAQAFSRLGSQVTIVQNDPKFLPREERDAAELLSRAMARDGVVIRLNTTVVTAQVERGVRLLGTVNNEIKSCISTDEILLSIGRAPNVDGLNLEAAGIDLQPERGVKVDDFLCTTNGDIYSAGDVCMSHKFTNVAEASARLAVQNALQGERKRKSHLTIPWCTFCDPEIAHIGMQVWEARRQSIPVKTFTVMMQDVDRAITDGQDDGFVKIHVKEGTDTILGATIVASRASEMINELSVVMSAGIGMRGLANVLHIYPAQCDAIRLAAMAYEEGQRSSS
jgi:pyruvate/2-oxoglutarate dehydrogenase complex dihydrolipoamide dehydrogenase (E3) component